jgi:heme A synthase
MTVRHIRLALGLFFLVAGLALLAFRFGAPEAAARLNDPTRLFLGGLLALALGGLNVARWYAGWIAFERAATPVRRPFEADQAEGGEYNPEFDFNRQEKPSQT